MTEQAPKARRGCFFYGCITSLVLFAIILAALLAGLHYVKKMVNQYTDTQPMELPTVQMSKGEVDELKQRFAAFQDAVRAQRPTKPLTLTADDINALIANSAEQQAWQGKFYLSLTGDQVKGELSLPLHEMGLAMFKGRYLNGSATFNLSFQQGTLSLTPQTIIVKGKPLPEQFMQQIRTENLAAGLTNEPKAVAVLQGLRDIQVKDGKLLVEPKTTP